MFAHNKVPNKTKKGSTSMSTSSKILAQLSAMSGRKGVTSNHTLTVSMEGDVSTKRPPQAIRCLDVAFTLSKEGKETVTEQQLIEALPDDLSVKQTNERIYRYYRSTLIEAGWLKIAG